VPVTFKISALAKRTGVSARTIRYYVSEGLLPAPRSRGRYAEYGVAHLNRLRLIGQLKSEYLPLREIRDRIAHLTESEVVDCLETGFHSGVSSSIDDVIVDSSDVESAWIRYRLEDGLELSVRTGLPPWRERIVRRIVSDLRRQLRDW